MGADSSAFKALIRRLRPEDRIALVNIAFYS